MIVRDTGSEWWCISQLDHARISGAIASSWKSIPRPRYASVIRAITYHDAGWFDYEAHPEWSAQSDGPYQFFDLPFHPNRLKAHLQAIDWMVSVDAYSGLLLSRHRTGLRRSRYGMVVSETRPAKTIDPAELHFIELEEHRQKTLVEENRWDWSQIEADYRFLQLCDLWSMFVCRGAAKPFHVATIAGLVPESAGSTWELTPVEADRVMINPWPFEAQRLDLPLWIKSLPKLPFGSQTAFEDAFSQAVPFTKTISLIPYSAANPA